VVISLMTGGAGNLQPSHSAMRYEDRLYVVYTEGNSMNRNIGRAMRLNSQAAMEDLSVSKRLRVID